MTPCRATDVHRASRDPQPILGRVVSLRLSHTCVMDAAMDRQQLGRHGEDLAATYLEGIGWRVVERRWRCKSGEVDLVAQEPGTRPVTVFCEVKTRSGMGYGGPLEAITEAKVSRLRQLAWQWMREHDVHGRTRVDGIGVLLQPGWAPLITHVEGIS